MSIGGSRLNRNAGIAAQLALAAVVLAGLAFAPPDRGEMLVIPLDGHRVNPLLLKQAPLVPERPGPLPGSMLVFGSSEGQFIPLLRQGVLIMSVPQPLCGAHSEGDA
jgi:hypothetical protein